jgi:DNA-binding CsgD family transcriptional regulator
MNNMLYKIIGKYNSGMSLDDICDSINSPNIDITKLTEIIDHAIKEGLITKKRKKVYLSKRDRQILNLWNTEVHTYQSISSKFSITRERVRQILKKAKENGFEIKDTNLVSQQRASNRINEACDRVDKSLFSEFYLDGKPMVEMCRDFSISAEIYYAVEDELIKKKTISSKERILNEVKKSMESISEIEKYREGTILQMRANNQTYDQICSKLDISRPRVSQIIKRMKDKGIDIPNSRNSGWFLDENETLKRVNNIEECLNRGMNMRKISNVLGITPHTVKSLIYIHFVKNG